MQAKRSAFRCGDAARQLIGRIGGCSDDEHLLAR